MNKKIGILNLALCCILTGILFNEWQHSLPVQHFSAAMISELQQDFGKGGSFGDELTHRISEAAGQQDYEKAWQLSQCYFFVHSKPQIQNENICWTDFVSAEKTRQVCGILEK